MPEFLSNVNGIEALKSTRSGPVSGTHKNLTGCEKRVCRRNAPFFCSKCKFYGDNRLMARTGERWIKLRLHRNHPRIYELAELMECSTDTALACAIDWFRQLDAECNPERLYSRNAVNGIAGSVGSVGFASAALAMGWLTAIGDKLRPVDPLVWFSDPARKRLERSGVAADWTPNGSHTADRLLPAGSQTAAQSRVESDETRGHDSAGGRRALPPADSTDTTQQRDKVVKDLRSKGMPGLTAVEQLTVLQIVQESGIAKNNAGRALNWLRNVICDGAAFAKRIRQQALDQGLVEGSHDFARYMYGAIRSEAQQINRKRSAPIDAPVTHHQDSSDDEQTTDECSTSGTDDRLHQRGKERGE